MTRSDPICVIRVNLRLTSPHTLDSDGSHPYSLPFRTKQSEANKQRPVGSVGVEALLDQQDGRLTVIVA
jgi:hypothetical protein